MKVVLLLLLLGVVGCELVFEQWAQEHGKVYASWIEREYRQGVWTKNMNKILNHNLKYVKGEKTYEMGMNEHGDLTFEEFRKHKSCMRGKSFNATDFGKKMPKVHYNGSTFLPPVVNYTLPKQLDFRKLGYVTKVKNQGQCGSCWAFSTTGALEGQIFRKTGKLPALSEQQLVDCAGRFGNAGCDGGLMDSAFLYIMSKKGLMSEKSYPYTAEDGECQYDQTKVVASVAGYIDIPEGKENMLTLALASNGPIAVAIDASQDSFQFYKSGVYNEPDCSSEELDHGVLAVGYGVSAKGTPYYLVKNSWGPSWGMGGYIQMTRNGKNQCGIASSASFPLV